MVSARPEPRSGIPAEWPVWPTAGIINGIAELASIHHNGTPVLPTVILKAMAKAYKRLRRRRTERRVKNQSFMEPSKRPLTGKRKKSFIRSLFSKPRRAVS